MRLLIIAVMRIKTMTQGWDPNEGQRHHNQGVCFFQLFFMLLLYRHFTIHHANVRLFMWNLSMSLLLQSLYFIINAIVNVMYLAAPVTIFSFDVLSCQLASILTSTATLADICSTFGMGVDRLYATLARKFDDPKRSGVLSKLLVFGTWSITAVVNVYALVENGVSLKQN